jgi:hypothetical protein
MSSTTEKKWNQIEESASGMDKFGSKVDTMHTAGL